MRRYRSDLEKLRAKIPEPAEDELTEDAKRLHKFLSIKARERGEEYTGTMEGIRAMIERRRSMSQEEVREE